MRNACRILKGKPEENIPTGRPMLKGSVMIKHILKMVEEVCYKPEDRGGGGGSDFFFLPVYLILPAAPWLRGLLCL
jgi:hypothetical protein